MGAPQFGRVGIGRGASFDYGAWYVQCLIDRYGLGSSGWSGGDPPVDNLGPWRWWQIARSATVGYFPATGNLGAGEGAFWGVSANGYVWSSSRSTDARYGHNLNVNATGVIPSNAALRSSGLSVRCVQEEVTIFRNTVVPCNVPPRVGIFGAKSLSLTP